MAEIKLQVKNLTKIFPAKNKKENTVTALSDINLEVRESEFVVIVGPSGCGKSTLLNIIGGLEEATEGEVWLEGKVVCEPGADRGMVFQGYSLFPWLTVQKNVEFGLKMKRLPAKEQSRIAGEYIKMVGLSGFENALPKQLSGGMKQRVVIAMALVSEPNLLLADEPTTALDVTIQAQILTLMKNLQEKLGTSMIFITHDLGIVAEFCENVAVVYGGEVIERGSVEQIFSRTTNHPYTNSLFNCIPDLTSDANRLTPIPGFVLDMRDVPVGCPFADRCSSCMERCKQEKPTVHTVKDGHDIKCHLFDNEVSK